MWKVTRPSELPHAKIQIERKVTIAAKKASIETLDPLPIPLARNRKTDKKTEVTIRNVNREIDSALWKSVPEERCLEDSAVAPAKTVKTSTHGSQSRFFPIDKASNRKVTAKVNIMITEKV